MNNCSMSRVARRRDDARRRMLDAAVELIGESGVEGLRMREIGERADVGFGSFYSHFASKEELVAAVVADRVAAVTGPIMERAYACVDPAEGIAVAHRLFLRVALADPTLARMIVQLGEGELSDATGQALGGLLARDGRGDPDVLVPFAVGATLAVLRRMTEGRINPGFEDRSARVLLRACGVPDAEAAEIAAAPLED
jgi:AcrR family transcriptional regulator